MGYYTEFRLTIEKPDSHGIYSDSDAVIAANEYFKIKYFYDDHKWYDHIKDMKAFSRKHPKVVFRLYGKGENDDDMWVKYFSNGKMHEIKASIKFDRYDESKLK